MVDAQPQYQEDFVIKPVVSYPFSRKLPPITDKDGNVSTDDRKEVLAGALEFSRLSHHPYFNAIIIYPGLRAEWEGLLTSFKKDPENAKYLDGIKIQYDEKDHGYDKSIINLSSLGSDALTPKNRSHPPEPLSKLAYTGQETLTRLMDYVQRSLSTRKYQITARDSLSKKEVTVEFLISLTTSETRSPVVNIQAVTDRDQEKTRVAGHILDKIKKDIFNEYLENKQSGKAQVEEILPVERAKVFTGGKNTEEHAGIEMRINMVPSDESLPSNPNIGATVTAQSNPVPVYERIHSQLIKSFNAKIQDHGTAVKPTAVVKPITEPKYLDTITPKPPSARVSRRPTGAGSSPLMDKVMAELQRQTGESYAAGTGRAALS